MVLCQFCPTTCTALRPGMGFSAANKHKPRLYAWFANIALTGIIVQARSSGSQQGLVTSGAGFNFYSTVLRPEMDWD